MFIWSGFGFLVPLILIINTVLLQFFINNIFNNPSFYQQHIWPHSLTLCITGIFCYILSCFFKRKKKVYIDTETKENVILTKKHGFFFIDIKYWAIILPAIGIISLIINAIKGTY